MLNMAVFVLINIVHTSIFIYFIIIYRSVFIILTIIFVNLCYVKYCPFIIHLKTSFLFLHINTVCQMSISLFTGSSYVIKLCNSYSILFIMCIRLPVLYVLSC